MQCSSYVGIWQPSVSQSGCNVIYGHMWVKAKNEWADHDCCHITLIWKPAVCSFFVLTLALFVSCIYIPLHFSPSPALLCPVLLSQTGGSSQINCHALVANRFREAERESLSKWRLHLGVGQCYKNACLALCVHTLHTEILHFSYTNNNLFSLLNSADIVVCCFKFL